MTSEALPILIAGGGIGGIAAALALTRRGFAVKVLEQAPALSEIGAGRPTLPTDSSATAFAFRKSPETGQAKGSALPRFLVLLNPSATSTKLMNPGT